MSNSTSKFYLKQTTESCIIKSDWYSYISECSFTKNGKKQIWRYESFCNKTKCTNLFKRIL